EPDARAVTASAGGPLRFLRQRSRWVSRYRHAVHYRPAFLLGLCVLGFESLAVVAATLAAPFAPPLLPLLVACYAAQTAAMVVGMTVGARQLGRPYLGGLTALAWALLHPWLIAAAVLWSWLAPSDWRAGAVGYRRGFVRRRWRPLLRALSARPECGVRREPRARCGSAEAERPRAPGGTMKVFVLGGDGFCGWPTSLHLSQLGHDVVVLDNLSRRNIDNELEAGSLTPIQPMGERVKAWREVTGLTIRFER